METKYINVRLHKETYDALRKFESREKRRTTINGTVDYLLRYHKAMKKLHPDTDNRLRFHLN